MPQEKVKMYNYEYRGICNKCGRWLEGSEIFDSERGWVFSWTHVDYNRQRTKLCLAA